MDLGLGILYVLVLLGILAAWVRYDRQNRDAAALPELVEPLLVSRTDEGAVVVSGQEDEITPVEVQSAAVLMYFVLVRVLVFAHSK